MTLSQDDLNQVSEMIKNTQITDGSQDLEQFKKSSFYNNWSTKFSKLGLTGVIGLPNTTFEEWLFYFQKWSEQFVNAYNQFVQLINSTLATMDDEFNEFKNQLPEYILSQLDQAGLLTKENFGYVENIKQPIGTSAVDKLNNEITQRAVNVEWFTKLATETTDDGRIQRAIDSLNDYETLIFASGKTYTIAAGMQVSNKSNIIINGNGAKLQVVSNLATLFVFSYLGTVNNLDIGHFTIVNSNPNPNNHLTAFGSDSGNIFTNSRIHHFSIYSMNVGISLNADLGGTVENNKVYENRIYNVSGSDSGQGYGIHTAYGNYTQIYNNYIDNAGRHAIYIAEGSYIQASYNIIKNHRLNNASNNYRPAINIARAAVNINIDHNIFDNIRDSAIQIGNQNEKGDMRNVVVENNTFINWVNVPAVRIGSDATTVSPYFTYNIIVRNNAFVTNTLFAAIVITMGDGVVVTGNNIRHINPASRVDAIAVNQAVTNSLDNVVIKNNTINVEGGLGKSAYRGVSFSGLAPTGNANIQAEGNNFIGLYSDTQKEYFDYFSGVAITNPNLNYINNRVITKKNTAPSTGYHEVGEIAYNSYPKTDRNVGWVCTDAGAPGTWVAFGTF